MAKRVENIKEIRRQNLMAIRERYESDSDGDFAERIEVKPAYYSLIKTNRRGIGEDLARRIEARLGLPHGELDKPEPGSLGEKLQLSAFGKVPVISWVTAGSWAEADMPIQPEEAQEWMHCPAPKYSENTYALVVRGDSMTAPFGRSYPNGCIIFVDPEIRGVSNGDRVIAKIVGQPEVTFKQFVEEDGRRFLKPLNPAYPVITDEFRVIGKIIGAWQPE
ncbi:MAG: XRE family transcriptional regulator [Pseudomonadota bacterium]